MKRDTKNSGIWVILALLFILFGNLGNIRLSWGTYGVIGIIIIILVLLFAAAAIRKSKARNASGDLAAEDKIRAMQSRTEERLREQAKAPDLKQQPAKQGWTPAGEPVTNTGIEESRERTEELRSLYEAGIITQEEYRERIRALVKKN